MGIFIPWLSEAARLTGYPVSEVTGWRTRGTGGHERGMHAVECVVAHHTAGPRAGEMPSLAVIRDGRAGLSGPLAHLGLGRSGTVYVVAAGAANHAGVSTWAGVSGLNSRAIGIEAEDDGDGTWSAEQLDCYPRLVAALLHYMRRDASRACAHRECATPLGRKPDPAGIDMRAFRARVAGLLADPLRLIPRGGAKPSPTRRPVEDDAMTPEDRRYFDKRFGDIWAVLGVRSDTTGGQRDRITDLWDALQIVRVDLASLHGVPPAGGAASLSDDLLARVAVACADEQDRRAAARLA